MPFSAHWFLTLDKPGTGAAAQTAAEAGKWVATGLVTQIRFVDALLKANARQISERVSATGSTLTNTVGIGAITAGRLIGRTGRARRFPTAAAFANYAGAAPIEVDTGRPRARLLQRSPKAKHPT